MLRKDKARLLNNLIGSEEIEGVCFWDQGMGGHLTRSIERVDELVCELMPGGDGCRKI